jgi:hypothetical protein
VDVTQRAWDFMSRFTLPPACPPAPTDGCQAAASRQAVLRLDTGATLDGRKLRWKWVNDGTVLPGDFGDPTATTAYALCVYDQTGRVMTATVPARGTCAGKPCWAPTGTGARYGNKTLLSDGLRTLALKSGGDGQARIKAKGKGANLRVPTLPLTTPVRVQLRRLDTGACWEATYGSAVANTTTAFKARSD